MQTPFKPIDFLSRDVRTERRGDGTIGWVEPQRAV